MWQQAYNLYNYFTGSEQKPEQQETKEIHKEKEAVSAPPKEPEVVAPLQKEYATVMLSVHCATMLRHANAFKSVLISRGYTVFLCDAMVAGEDYRDEISVAAANCKIFIPFINLPWCRSRECGYEFKIALRKNLVSGIPVLLPIILENFAVFKEFPVVDGLLCSTNGIVAQETDLNDAFWKKVLEAMKKHDTILAKTTPATVASPPASPSPSPAASLPAPPLVKEPPPPSPSIIATIEPFDPSIIAKIESMDIVYEPFGQIYPDVVAYADFNTLHSMLYVSKNCYRISKQKLRGNVFTLGSAPTPQTVFSGIACRQFDGGVFVTSVSARKIFKINNRGIIDFSGSGGGFPYKDGSATEATFDELGRIACYQRDGSLYVIDKNRIRKIAVDGSVSVHAGGQRGCVDGPAAEARFFEPKDLTVDQRDGSLYVADFGNNKIRKISPTGEVTTIAGSSNGCSDGPALEAKFSLPNSLAFDDDNGFLFVGDSGNKKIRKIDLEKGDVTTEAGSGATGLKDGTALEATLTPTNIAFHSRDKSVFITELGNRLVRKIAEGQVSTIGVQGKFGERADGSFANVTFASPTALAIRDRAIYVVDGHTVRKIFL